MPLGMHMIDNEAGLQAKVQLFFFDNKCSTDCPMLSLILYSNPICLPSCLAHCQPASQPGQGRVGMMRKRSFCNDTGTTSSFLPGASGGALVFQRPLERLPIGPGVQDAVQTSRVGMIESTTLDPYEFFTYCFYMALTTLCNSCVNWVVLVFELNSLSLTILIQFLGSNFCLPSCRRGLRLKLCSETVLGSLPPLVWTDSGHGQVSIRVILFEKTLIRL